MPAIHKGIIRFAAQKRSRLWLLAAAAGLAAIAFAIHVYFYV